MQQPATAVSIRIAVVAAVAKAASVFAPATVAKWHPAAAISAFYALDGMSLTKYQGVIYFGATLDTNFIWHLPRAGLCHAH